MNKCESCIHYAKGRKLSYPKQHGQWRVCSKGNTVKAKQMECQHYEAENEDA